MELADWLIVALRVVACGGFLVGFWPAVRRIATSETRAIWRTRVALAALLATLGATQAYSIAFRVWDYQSLGVATLVAVIAAAAGGTCCWAFWPWRREP